MMQMTRRGFLSTAIGAIASVAAGGLPIPATQEPEKECYKLMTGGWIPLKWDDMRKGDRILAMGERGVRMTCEMFTVQGTPHGELGNVEISDYVDLLKAAHA